MKLERWKVQKNKLFTYQVGFTSPPRAIAVVAAGLKRRHA